MYGSTANLGRQLTEEVLEMTSRFFSWVSALGIAGALISWTPLPMVGQPRKAAPSKSSSIPRMPDGHPDLQGTYDLAIVTPLERLPGDPPFLTKKKADELLKAELARRADDHGLDSGTGPAKSFFVLAERAGGGATGAYNRFWLEQGMQYTVVDGQIRTSIVVDPADGHVPPFNTAERKRAVSMRGVPTSDQRENQDPTAEPAGAFDNPEQRPLGERCILGFGSTSGPPVLPDYFYNDLHQVVQTPDSIMILTEMVHDARIIRMNATHLPKAIRRWMGDSVGHWEGDTLVIDTTNFNDKTRFRGSTENLHVIERFARVDDKTLLYRFTVEDPATWDRPWSGEYTWPLTEKHIYEYACHEGNYALANILRGARHQEAEAAKGSK